MNPTEILTTSLMDIIDVIHRSEVTLDSQQMETIVNSFSMYKENPPNREEQLLQLCRVISQILVHQSHRGTFMKKIILQQRRLIHGLEDEWIHSLRVADERARKGLLQGVSP